MPQHRNLAIAFSGRCVIVAARAMGHLIDLQILIALK
jgi:hypothetical protein